MTRKKTTDNSVFLVFEYCDHSLAGMLEQKTLELSDSQIKLYFKQMLQGLSFLHSCGVVHRDIKGANILINNDGAVKLADFGLSRFIFPSGYGKRYEKDFTTRVVTTWYRPPELLLGSALYDSKLDMWSIG